MPNFYKKNGGSFWIGQYSNSSAGFVKEEKIKDYICKRAVSIKRRRDKISKNNKRLIFITIKIHSKVDSMAEENKVSKKNSKNIILIGVIIAVAVIAVIFAGLELNKGSTTAPVSNQTTIQNTSASRLQFLSDIGKFSSTPNIKILYNMTAFNPSPNASSNSSQLLITYYKSGNNQSAVITPKLSISQISFYFVNGRSLECSNLPSISSINGVNTECNLYNVPEVYNFPKITNINFVSNPSTTIIYHNQSSVNGRVCNLFTISVPESEVINISSVPPSFAASFLNTSIITTECLDNQYGYPSYMNVSVITQNRTATKLTKEFTLVAENISSGNINPSQFVLPASFALVNSRSGTVSCNGHNMSFGFTPFKDMLNPNLSINASAYNSTSKKFVNIATINKTLNGTYSAFNNYTINVSSSKNISNDGLNICMDNSCVSSYCLVIPPSVSNSTISKTSVPTSSNVVVTTSNTAT